MNEDQFFKLYVYVNLTMIAVLGFYAYYAANH